MDKYSTTVFVDFESNAQLIITDLKGKTLLAVSPIGEEPLARYNLNRKQLKEIILRLYQSYSKLEGGEKKCQCSSVTRH